MFKLRIPSTIFFLRTAVVRAAPYLTAVASTVAKQKTGKHETGHPGTEPGSPEFLYHLVISVFLVLAGGIFAGSV